MQSSYQQYLHADSNHMMKYELKYPHIQLMSPSVIDKLSDERILVCSCCQPGNVNENGCYLVCSFHV